MDRIINCTELEKRINSFFESECERVEKEIINDKIAFRILTAIEVKELQEKKIIEEFLSLCLKYDI